MKQYIIDGYNLLLSKTFPTPHHLDLEGKREHLIRVISSFAITKKADALIVFDNSKKPSQRISSAKSTKVVYCKPGMEADDYIKQIIRKSAVKDIIVVTSDQEIQYSAKDHGASILDCPKFCRLMHPPKTQKKSKYNPQKTEQKPKPAGLSEKDVAYWKNLFEKGKDENN